MMVNFEPVCAIAALHGKTPLAVLEELRTSLIEDHPEVIRKNPTLMDRLNELVKKGGGH